MSTRYAQCDATCTVDCGHCKGRGKPLDQRGVAILLVYGAKLFPPRDGSGGVRCLVQINGDVEVTVVGYPTRAGAALALDAAYETCKNAGLVFVRSTPSGFVVRRRQPTLRR